MVIPLLPISRDLFHVDKAVLILPFGLFLGDKVDGYAIYLIERHATNEVYIGETSDIIRRSREHHNSVRSNGQLDTKSEFSSPVINSDLVWHIWPLKVNDKYYNLTVEHLVGIRYQTRNIGKVGKRTTEFYGYIFTTSDGKEIHTFCKELFYTMYNLPSNPSKRLLKQRGIVEWLATEEDVREAYASVFEQS
ncbi:GIY-YIG nuclease family protein [Vibrio sp.]|uniref:GIY-YIG nuclease family protein n=1 Tax=Vibrio sp. TaxID=678 RepID=UPI003AA8C60C